MAMTLEAALVFPLTISLVIGIVPPAVRSYRQIAAEAAVCRQASRLTADPASLYRLAPISMPGGPATGTPGAPDARPGGGGPGPGVADVLLTAPKQMLILMTAIVDDLEILGLAKP